MRHDRSTARRTRGPALAAALLFLATSLAAQVPSDSVMRGFQPSSEYNLTIEGQVVPSAEIYQNTKIPAMLILTTSLSTPVLLTPRTGAVETVHIMKVAKQKDGSVDLLADAVLAPMGQFKMVNDEVTFSLDHKTVRLVSRPALLGLKRNADLKTALPEYARGAKAYTPNAGAVAALKKENDAVVVKIYFGSWCPHCREHVPLLLRVEDDVKNPKIQFEYYGLPKDFNDPEAKKLGIKSVPTGIIYVNGREAGRLTGTGWNAPELLLSKMLVPAAVAPAKNGK